MSEDSEPEVDDHDEENTSIVAFSGKPRDKEENEDEQRVKKEKREKREKKETQRKTVRRMRNGTTRRYKTGQLRTK